MSERDVSLYVEDMLEFCGKALAYSAGLTEVNLAADTVWSICETTCRRSIRHCARCSRG